MQAELGGVFADEAASAGIVPYAQLPDTEPLEQWAELNNSLSWSAYHFAICHLPLVLPPDCQFRVGNETRQWRIGETLIFDDTIEHEAWNRSGQIRTVLIFDIWHPGLSDDERAFFSRTVAALDRFNESA